MTTPRWKEQGRRLARPLVLTLDRLGVTPDTVTVAGLLLSWVAAWLLARGALAGGALVLAAGSLLDMLDGGLARLQGTSSARGAFLDSNVDRLSEAAVYAGLAWQFTAPGAVHRAAVLWCVLALGGSLCTSYARARAEGLGRECRGGWLQRPERMIALIAALLLGRPVLVPVLALLAAGTWLTTFQRIVAVSRDMGREPPGGDGS